MALKPTKSNTLNQENSKSIQTNRDVREFYLIEKLYQVMREDKNRGKRPSAEEFYLMEKLYHTMVNDKNRNKKLLKSGS
jgi:uncharacterized membrane protein